MPGCSQHPKGPTPPCRSSRPDRYATVVPTRCDRKQPGGTSCRTDRVHTDPTRNSHMSACLCANANTGICTPTLRRGFVARLGYGFKIYIFVFELKESRGKDTENDRKGMRLLGKISYRARSGMKLYNGNPKRHETTRKIPHDYPNFLRRARSVASGHLRRYSPRCIFVSCRYEMKSNCFDSNKRSVMNNNCSCMSI